MPIVAMGTRFEPTPESPSFDVLAFLEDMSLKQHDRGCHASDTQTDVGYVRTDISDNID